MKIKQIKKWICMADAHDGLDKVEMMISVYRDTLRDIIRDAGPSSKAGRKAKAALGLED